MEFGCHKIDFTKPRLFCAADMPGIFGSNSDNTGQCNLNLSLKFGIFGIIWLLVFLTYPSNVDVKTEKSCCLYFIEMLSITETACL